MSTPTSLSKKGTPSNYFSLTSKISFLRQRRSRTSQELQKKQTSKQSPQLRERQSALTRHCDESITVGCDESITVACDESITIACDNSLIGRHNVSIHKPPLSKEEQLRLYKLQLGGAGRQMHGHFVGAYADVSDEFSDDSEDESYDDSEDESYDESGDEDYEEQLRQYKLQLGGLRR